jgi:hypothetical protein
MKRSGLLFLVVALVSCAAGGAGGGGFSPSGGQGGSQARHAPLGKGAAATTAFTTDGRKIMLSVNGGAPSVFYIKGVDYSPTQICSTYLAPLDDTNSAIWMQDLPQLRKLGANAIKVYNMDLTRPSPGVWNVTSIKKWLKAAYNNGVNPVYTIVSIPIPPNIPDQRNKYAVISLSHQYYTLAKTLGTDPDLMGISMGGEWNQSPYSQQADTWNKAMNPIINAAYQGLVAVGAQKIITTTLVDDVGAGALSTMAQGEKYGFPTGGTYGDKGLQFVWGYDEYPGDTPGAWSIRWAAVQKYTKHPFIASEWGSPTGYHPHPNSNPNLIEEWPSPDPSASPTPPPLSLLTNYIDYTTAAIYRHATINPSADSPVVASGGFVFEWSDEWYKGDPQTGCKHLAGPPLPPHPNSAFPGGFDDEGWFGLNSVATSASPGPNAMTQRPNFAHLKADWASQL